MTLLALCRNTVRLTLGGALLTALATGCVANGARPSPTIKTPDTPLVLLRPVRAYVAVEDPPESGQLVEYGWVTLEPGQTVFWYDWAPVSE